MPGELSTVTTSQPSSRSRRATWPPPVATSSALTPSSGSHIATTASRSSPCMCVVEVRYASARPLQRSLMTAPTATNPPPPLFVRLRRAHGSCGELHRTARRVEHRRLDEEVRRRRVAENLPPLLRVRTVEPNDDRQLDRHLLERREDAARDFVAARDAAEDVE